MDDDHKIINVHGVDVEVSNGSGQGINTMEMYELLNDDIIFRKLIEDSSIYIKFDDALVVEIGDGEYFIDSQLERYYMVRRELEINKIL